MERFISKRLPTAANEGSDHECLAKQIRKYEQKPRSTWLQDKRFRKWLIETGKGLQCKYCHCSLKSKLHGLIRHAATSKHINAASPFMSGSQPTVSFIKKQEMEVHRAELANALFIGVHTSIRVVDHLTILQSGIFSDSKAAPNLKLRRSKCSAILKNVLSPYFKSLLMADLKDNKFSLIIDEATDITTKKYVGIVVRYYSNSSKVFVNTFLKLAELEKCTADGIVLAISNTLKEFNLSFENMVGVGTDNASVMVGVNNGVITRLKEFNANIKLVPCICHSIQLAVCAASKCMPNEIEFIISETYNWFSKSSLRQAQYESLYSTINDGMCPLKITRACETRWLSIEPAVKRIVDQWLELKTHFGIAALNESCHKAQLLSKMYTDENLAYFQFLKPILSEVQKVNKLFESNIADPMKLFSEVVYLISSLCISIVSPSEDFNPLTSELDNFFTPIPYFHYNFEQFIRQKKEENTINESTENEIRNICRKFIMKLIEQLRQRLPHNINTLKKIDFFSTENTLKTIKPQIFDYFENEKNNFNIDEITCLEMQWRNIHLYDWKNVNNTLDFWIEVKEYKNSVNDNPFNELANFVFSLLVLPLSNAEVERTFSMMNCIKNKQRNKINLVMLNTLLTIRCGLKRLNKCCHDFVIKDDLLKLMRNDIYDCNNNDDIVEDFCGNEEFDIF